MTDESLCQDCLRPQPAHPTNDGICACGGATCSCPHCLNTLTMLRAGVMNPNTLGLQMHISGWNEKDGAQLPLPEEPQRHLGED